MMMMYFFFFWVGWWWWLMAIQLELKRVFSIFWGMLKKYVQTIQIVRLNYDISIWPVFFAWGLGGPAQYQFLNTFLKVLIWFHFNLNNFPIFFFAISKPFTVLFSCCSVINFCILKIFLKIWFFFFVQFSSIIFFLI